MLFFVNLFLLFVCLFSLSIALHLPISGLPNAEHPPVPRESGSEAGVAGLQRLLLPGDGLVAGLDGSAGAETEAMDPSERRRALAARLETVNGEMAAAAREMAASAADLAAAELFACRSGRKRTALRAKKKNGPRGQRDS